MAAPPPEAVIALVTAQAAARQQIADAVAARVTAQTAAFTGWYADAAVAAFAQRLARFSQAGARTTASITDAYLSRVASLLSGRRIRPAGVIDTSSLRAGVPPSQVYERLAVQYRYQISQGAPPAEAHHRASERAGLMASMDSQLAHRDQSEKFMVVNSVDGWRRIVRPELSKSGTCGLCIVAADRLYFRKDLMAVHERCKCEVLPVINGVDPGLELNRKDLDALYAAAGSNKAADLKRTRITVEQHSELGGVLRAADQHFRGPSEVAA